MHIVKFILCTLYTILRFISIKYIGTDFEPKAKAKSDIVLSTKVDSTIYFSR